MKNYWIYQGKRVSDLKDIPEGVFGFVYKIIADNKKYIGKKQLFSKRKKKFGKKQIALLTDRRSKKYEYVITETNWQTYNSSCIPLKELIEKDVKVKVKKEILCYCYSDLELKYQEVKHIMLFDAMINEDYYNANVQIKIIGKLKFNKNE